jgi:ABC-type polysaccharide/polyol phosphate transport system ATPase subunit
MKSHTEFNFEALTSKYDIDNPPAIIIDEVSVHYRLQPNRPTSAKEFAIRVTRRNLKSNTVKALDSVSFLVYPGEVFGIIGRNGAGKSTLLKVISGIMIPNKGRVRVWGKVVSLLGVGAGFHPELSGYENIYLYSAILGRSKEQTDRLIEEIIGFAELEDFINSPLRVYSTGMVARLGFAVAMAEIPRILLVDEVLGVGDEKFRRKCEYRFKKFQKQGTTVLIVSHSTTAIAEMCNRAIWLEEGRVGCVGPSNDVIQKYQEYLRNVKKTKRIRST